MSNTTTWITPAEAGKILRQTPRIARERAQAGEFGPRAAIRDGRRWLISEQAIRGYLHNLARSAA